MRDISTSVILLTYNRSDALSAVLYGLSRQKILPSEIIITDDGSTPLHVDAIAKLLKSKKWPFNIKYIWHPDTGFTASLARNQGVRYSTGDYLVFIDGDCVPRYDFLSEHLRLSSPGCFVNGSRILLSQKLTGELICHPEMIDNSVFFWLRQRLTGQINKWLPTVIHLPQHFRRAATKFRWSGIRSCNFSVFRNDFIKVNGFDESFVGWGHEDADFVWRLQMAGCRRINGYWSTEVFHLWHPEAKRGHESTNARRLHSRMSDPNTRYEADLGIMDASANSAIVIISILDK